MSTDLRSRLLSILARHADNPEKTVDEMEEYVSQRAIHFAKWADDKVVYMKNGEMDPTWDDLYVEYQKQLKAIK